MADRDLRALKRTIKRMNELKATAQKINEQTTLSTIRTNISLLNEEWNDHKVREKNIDATDDNVKYLDAIDDLYFNTKSALVQAENDREGTTTNAVLNNTMDDLVANQQSFLRDMSVLNKRETEIRLPQINIPPFSGNYSEFPSFRDLFEASIDSNEKISNVHKLQYLKGLLRGEAAALVRHIPITEVNYVETWSKIKERYDKRKQVVTQLIKQFMEQPTINHSTAKTLHYMCDVSDEVIRGLKVLGEEAERRDPWLIFILLKKLDEETKREWAHHVAENDFPTIELFFKFLNRRSDELESCSSQVRVSQGTTKIRTHHTTVNETKCPKCTSAHHLSKCDEFLEMNVSDRRGFTAKNRLCFNCLAGSHQAGFCKIKHRCNICNRKHNVLLHTEISSVSSPSTKTGSYEKYQPSAPSSTDTFCTEVQSNATATAKYQSILPTAIVNVKRYDGTFLKCRVLLDSGSQASFVSEACMQALRLPRKNANIVIRGLAASTITSQGDTTLSLYSVYDQHIQIDINALIIQNLPSQLPKRFISVEDSKLFQNLQLADNEYFRPGRIDILIGADKFFNTLEDGRVMNPNGAMIAQKTIFGWVISGKPQVEDFSLISGSSFAGCHISLDLNIDQTLRRFWEIEEVNNYEPYSIEEKECEENFRSTNKRLPNGRYIVRIPFRKDAPCLGNSIQTATKRFYNLEKKLQSNHHLRKEYSEVMDDYISQGHMRIIPESEIETTDERSCCYLPHHAVIKEGSSTTKVRVVFDGSCRTSTGVSPNDTMMVGPTIQPTLWSILLKFRNHRIALTADIEKMYRQVLVDERDIEYQRILWRPDPSSKLNHYRLTTVTFGLASSSFLATRVLHQIALDNNRSNACSTILNDFYVDDLISGADSIHDAMKLKASLIHTLKSGGFPLRKWRSNYSDLSDTLDAGLNNINFDDEKPVIKILGLQWNPSKDTFTFRVNLDNTAPTKRQILSEASRIFDPLGWVSPSIVSFKILLQKLWMLKVDWDDELPEELSTYYQKIKQELHQLERLQIPRFIPHQQVEYHGFCDASERAYAAVIYARSMGDNGRINVNLITAKTKVTPIKQVSIPRLELCGAQLLAKLWKAMKNNVPEGKFIAWTDSTIVLQWLSDYPANWKTFVANRTAAILDVLPREHWNHVSSNHNPADHASRGVTASQLVLLEQWWTGPQWLTQNSSSWPTSTKLNYTEDADQERRSPQACSMQTNLDEDIVSNLINKYSNYNKLIRVLAYLLRFTSKKKLVLMRNKYLTTAELTESENKLIKKVQQQQYENEINQLSNDKTIKGSSTLLSLTPFIDEEGILRVGGRLDNMNGKYNVKHPIILPSSHSLSRLIISFFHRKYFHPGPSLTSHLIKQKFWIVSGRSLIRNELRKCVTCTRYRAETSKQLMGNLPEARITPARPFSKCGVDYAGPIQIATKRGRGSKSSKGYISVFVCMVTKAVHIELVSDLTSEAFIATLKRFIARRGIPADMYSDNGTTFTGAHRKLKDVYHLVNSKEHLRVVSDFVNENRINWHFIPPVAPHFGGLWEAAVKSVKSTLIRATNGINLTFEEMSTLLCQIESIVNSRPLCAITNEDSSYEPLTPSHFLIGTATGLIPDENLVGIPEARLRIWQKIEQRTQSFWKKFSKEYINTLQQRSKWKTQTKNIEINDLVVLKEDNLPPCKWALARVISTYPDDDGMVRVVTVQTATTILKRPITKICKLPTSC